GKYDILLGTQMVAKGLDFPNVTVVGVIGAEKSAFSSDYRSSERTFSLLTQVIGRAGRGDDAGVAIVQTNEPDDNIIALAQNQDYAEFYREEIAVRQLRTYPPFCDIISLLVQSISQNDALDSANNILSNIKTLVEKEFNDVKIIALGPAPASLPRVNNKYRYTLLLKCKNNFRTRELVRSAISVNIKKDTSVIVDVNPENFS
ncbi:MAG: primosomal protein N', partial [Clostridia bacterium]|nr:primosomal protein N' [Clostridia bacterium]